jgi:hypothetical protein
MSEWIKACARSACVEVLFPDHGQHVLVRNSADPFGLLRFTPEEWDEFIAGVRRGAFDRPA